MPLYEFRCPDGHITEKRLSFKDKLPDTIVCQVKQHRMSRTPCTGDCVPRCYKRAQRIISAPGVIFKGEGWTLSSLVRDGGVKVTDDAVKEAMQTKGQKLLEDSLNGKEPDVFDPATGTYKNPKPAVDR